MPIGKKLTTPKAVLISDIHFNITTIDLATAALNQAIKTAEELDVLLIVAGDLHDTKASLRGECVKAMMDTIATNSVMVYTLIGNHDLLNEKGKGHSLEFLREYVELVDKVTVVDKMYLIPYQTDQAELKNTLAGIPKGSTVICHQGVNGANMGHYSQDRTSLAKGYFKDFRTISGHYHTRQTIDCGGIGKGLVGQFDYIGNPYTLNFGESTDPEKGFQVLNSDGTLTFVPTRLRKHVVFERTPENVYDPVNIHPNDLIKFKLHGIESEVRKISKRDIGMKLFGHCNFILEKTTTVAEKQISVPVHKRTESQLLDMIIEAKDEPKEYQDYLKSLVREFHENT